MLSLVGATRNPLTQAHRTGGFGGVAGLIAYLQENAFQGIVDATHPFAAQMSQNAFDASKALGLPLLRLERPPWPNAQGWLVAKDLTQAAEALPAGARAFLSVGRQSLSPFLTRKDVWFLTRSIEPAPQLPPHGITILQRPPFTLAGEIDLMKIHSITHLVSKNAGGAATRAKLEAAATLGIKVTMVNRPRLPNALTVETAAQAVKWVENLGE